MISNLLKNQQNRPEKREILRIKNLSKKNEEVIINKIKQHHREKIKAKKFKKMQRKSKTKKNIKTKISKPDPIVKRKG